MADRYNIQIRVGQTAYNLLISVRLCHNTSQRHLVLMAIMRLWDRGGQGQPGTVGQGQ